MIQGRKHHNVLVCSVYSARKYWRGPIHFAAGDEGGEEICKLICADKRLRGDYGETSWARWQPPTEPRGATYYSKCWMQELSPFDQTVFLDADTLVVKPLDRLFENLQFSAVVLTQFANWRSNGRKITGRLKPWAEVAPGDVREMGGDYEAINTGVISFDKSQSARTFFADWKETCSKRISFICDELAAQLIFWRHRVSVLDARYNCSPVHCDECTKAEAVIFHGHGFKIIKRDVGRALWMPYYQECCQLNIARLMDWTPGGDKHLKAYLASKLAVEKTPAAG